MKKLSIILSLLITASAAGQAPRWQANIGAEVKWFSVAPNGMLITGHLERPSDTVTYTRISGIDPHSGKIRWKFDPHGNDKIVSGVDVLPGGDIGLQVLEVPLTLLDPNDGRVIFESTSSVYFTRFNRYGFLQNNTQLWIDTERDNTDVLYLFDLINAKLLWSNSQIYEGEGIANKVSIGSKTFTSHKVKRAIMLCDPLITKSHMIAATNYGIFKIDLLTGLSVWQTGLPDPKQGDAFKLDLNQETIRLLAGENHFYFIRGANAMALNYEDGKMAWINFVKRLAL